MSTSGGGCGSLDKATKAYIFEYQEPATLNRPGATVVQNTWYDVLPETNNVHVYGTAFGIEDTNETLEWRAIIDGVTLPSDDLVATHSTDYYGDLAPDAISINVQCRLHSSQRDAQFIEFEGRTVQIQLRKTTAGGVGNLIGSVSYGVLTAI